MKGLPIGWSFLYIGNAIKSNVDIRREVYSDTCACWWANAKKSAVHSVYARK